MRVQRITRERLTGIFDALAELAGPYRLQIRQRDPHVQVVRVQCQRTLILGFGLRPVPVELLQQVASNAVPVREVRVDVEGASQGVAGTGDALGDGNPADRCLVHARVGKFGPGQSVVRVQPDGRLVENDRLGGIFPRVVIGQVVALEQLVVGLGIRPVALPMGATRVQCDVERLRNGCGDFVLDFEDVAEAAFIGLRPGVRAVGGANQL